MIIPNNGETRKPTYKGLVANPTLPGQMHVGHIELLAPPRKTKKRNGRFEPSKIGVLLCLHVFEIHHSDAPNISKSPFSVVNSIILTFLSTHEKGFNLYCTDSKHYLTWNFRRHKKVHVSCPTTDTVDGWNPAAPGMYETLKIMGYLPYQLVKDFSHQQ